jgi:hypothetical protein
VFHLYSSKGYNINKNFLFSEKFRRARIWFSAGLCAIIKTVSMFTEDEA